MPFTQCCAFKLECFVATGAKFNLHGRVAKTLNQQLFIADPFEIGDVAHTVGQVNLPQYTMSSAREYRHSCRLPCGYLQDEISGENSRKSNLSRECLNFYTLFGGYGETWGAGV
mmetsp:Transcript_64196/g.139728  ORF Transcript_64196/g.139728 Transcript_64196/m.139728 type:complete len:114 (-) Transcript_64196:331-672(-)